MRGTISDDYKLKIMQSTMMEVYHQPFSEVMEMGMEDCMFFMSLHDAQTKYEESLIKEKERAIKSRLLGLRGKW